MKSVRPGLYIGSQHDALYLLSGEYRGVTHILSVVPLCHDHKTVPPEPPRDKGVFHKAAAELYAKQPEFSGHITRKMIPVEDSVDEDLLAHLEWALRFIDEARRDDGIVLVHCGGGVSRSASIVTAYLMWKEGLSLSDALRSLKACSPKVSPNSGFMKQLQSFESRGFQGKDPLTNQQVKYGKHKKKADTKKAETKKSAACRICKRVTALEEFLLFDVPNESS